MKGELVALDSKPQHSIVFVGFRIRAVPCSAVALCVSDEAG